MASEEIDPLLSRTVLSMTNYLSDAMTKIQARQKVLRRVTEDQQSKLLSAGMGDYLNQLIDCIESNQNMLNDILSYSDVKDDTDQPKRRTMTVDHLRLQELLKQIVREWSADGESERRESFKPLMDELRHMYPTERGAIRVLVPGAGLARLPFDIALEGFHALANESSYLMLLTADFILNGCARKDNYRFYPWIHDLNNVLRSEDVLAPLSFPDVTAPQSDLSNLEVIQGDFLSACSVRNLDAPVNVVMTTFFLDCTSSSNVLDVVQTVYDALVPGGTWLNLGPLNFTSGFSRNEKPDKPLQLSWEELKKVMVGVGFVFVKEDPAVKCSYAQNQKSMMQLSYKCVFFNAKKMKVDGGTPVVELE